MASTSLHHVADLDEVLDQVAHALDGTIIVIEWARESFDEPTARWCFDRLGSADSHEGWLQHHRDAWRWDRRHALRRYVAGLRHGQRGPGLVPGGLRDCRPDHVVAQLARGNGKLDADESTAAEG